MFKAILMTQWKWSRVYLVLMVFAAFTPPLLAARDVSSETYGFGIPALLDSIRSWGLVYPLLASGIGLLLAMTAWSADHRGRHIYALSLPLPRWNYALLRFGAGGLLLVIPVVALWVGAQIAAAITALPPSLQAYPTVLAMRFGLAAFVAYALFFAVSAGTNRTAGYVLVAIAAIIATQLLLNSLDVDVNILDPMVKSIMSWPGPFEVFTGRWMLFDV
jgi:hypothetical protein